MAEFVSVGKILMDNFGKWIPAPIDENEPEEESAAEVAQQLFEAELISENPTKNHEKIQSQKAQHPALTVAGVARGAEICEGCMDAAVVIYNEMRRDGEWLDARRVFSEAI